MKIKHKGVNYFVGFAKGGRSCEHDSQWYLYILNGFTDKDILQIGFPKIVFIKGSIHKEDNKHHAD